MVCTSYNLIHFFLPERHGAKSGPVKDPECVSPLVVELWAGIQDVAVSSSGSDDGRTSVVAQSCRSREHDFGIPPAPQSGEMTNL